MTPDQENHLQHLDLEIKIAEKHLRIAQVKKQIAETELDIVGLQQTLRQQLGEGTPISPYQISKYPRRGAIAAPGVVHLRRKNVNDVASFPLGFHRAK